MILEAAEARGNWVRIDMEGSPYTQLTLETFQRVWESYRNVGVVVQSMLRRTTEDVERLIEMGARVRLVKGAYREPAIATHDDARIRHVLEHAERRGIPPERYEFQMLYGIRAPTQVAMVERGQRMRVYVPYGERWFPYFARRLRERRENVTFVLRNLLRR